MEFIDKYQSANQDEAHEIVDAFLREVDKESELYKRFADPLPDGSYPKKRMYALLVKEQCRCCYCMRRLQTDGTHSSIEHVIPQHVTKEVFDEYFAYGSTLNKAYIQHEEDYLKGDSQTPPYPHTVAYENIVLSCDGFYPNRGEAQSCNTKRGSDFVPPIAFVRDIHDMVEYYTNGTVRYLGKDEGLLPMVTILGLDVPIQKAIRRIWGYVTANGVNVNSCDHKELVYEIWMNCMEQLTQEETDALLLFEKQNFWELLLQYDYFNNPSVYKV